MGAWKKYIKIILATLLIVLIIFFSSHLAHRASDILLYMQEYPVITIFVLLGIYCLKSIVFIIPMAVLYIGSGALLSPRVAVAVTYLGLFCEISISYFIGRRLGSKKVADLIRKNKKARRFFSFNENDKSALCFLSRFLPLPSELASMFFGASDIRYLKFVFFSLLGLSPCMIPYVLMGDAVTNPLSKEFFIPFILKIFIFISSYVIYRKRKKDINNSKKL